jgi:hypothetical protein
MPSSSSNAPVGPSMKRPRSSESHFAVTRYLPGSRSTTRCCAWLTPFHTEAATATTIAATHHRLRERLDAVVGWRRTARAVRAAAGPPATIASTTAAGVLRIPRIDSASQPRAVAAPPARSADSETAAQRGTIWPEEQAIPIGVCAGPSHRRS